VVGERKEGSLPIPCHSSMVMNPPNTGPPGEHQSLNNVCVCVYNSLKKKIQSPNKQITIARPNKMELGVKNYLKCLFSNNKKIQVVQRNGKERFIC
jgi:hypothetical protein